MHRVTRSALPVLYLLMLTGNHPSPGQDHPSGNSLATLRGAFARPQVAVRCFFYGEERNMDAASAADEIRRVLRNELDDAERAIKAKDDRKALNELDDAMRKLKRIANDLT